MEQTWFLTKRVDQNINVLTICTKALYAINRKPEELEESGIIFSDVINQLQNFLELFEKAIGSHYLSNQQPPSISLHELAEATYKRMQIKASKLHEIVKNVLSEMQNERYSDQLRIILENIIASTKETAIEQWRHLQKHRR